MQVQAAVLGGLVQQASTIVSREAEISRELSTGSRLGSISGDPSAAAASVRLSSRLAEVTAAASAMQSVQSRMQTADSALGEVVSRLTSAVSTVVSGASGTANAANRAAMANQLASLRDSLMNLANSSYNGAYLFGGTKTQAAPFSLDAVSGQVTYSGDDRSTMLGTEGVSIRTSASGAAIFGSGATSVFGALQSVVDTLNNDGAPGETQVTGLRGALQTVIDQRSILGASAARLQDQQTYSATEKANLQVEQSSTVASDPVALATELTAAQTQRSALLSSLAILGKSSLFDYL